MLRDEWRFLYTAEELLSAAIAQRDFRKSRVQVWEDKKHEVMARIRAEGIDISDSLAADMSSGKYLSTHSERGPQIRVNITMQQDLTECFQKIKHHKELLDQYAAWVQVFESRDATEKFELHHDDWMFFFGK